MRVLPANSTFYSKMSSHSAQQQPRRQNAGHLLALCLVLLSFCCCYRVAAEAGAAEKHKLHFPSRSSEQKPAASKSDTDRTDNLLFNALSRIIPKDPEINRLNPPSDYLRVILNACGVFGLGVLWIKEITGAIGTPILAPILLPPLALFSLALLFLPDFSKLINNA